MTVLCQLTVMLTIILENRGLLRAVFKCLAGGEQRDTGKTHDCNWDSGREEMGAKEGRGREKRIKYC